MSQSGNNGSLSGKSAVHKEMKERYLSAQREKSTNQSAGPAVQQHDKKPINKEMPFFGDIELTEKQAKIMLAVENVDRDAFVRLGGATGADLNFEVTRDGAGPLLVACARGDLEFVNLMLSNMTLDIDKTDRNGVNSFFMAAYHGHIKVMRRLMEKGVAMFEKNANGSNVLHIAVKRGNMEVLKELIRIQYPLNEPKVNGITAVGIAAMKGSLEILQMLHENGADINQTSPAGIGPLYLAIKAQQHECVRYLVDEGADLYYSDPIRVDYSPVFVAVKMAQMSSIELMCDAGAKLDGFLDSQGYSPFMFAVKFGLHEVVNYLSLRGCDLNQADPANKTVLMYYLLHTDEILATKPISVLRLLDMARKLISRGADINHTSTTSQFGQTLLIQALKKNKVQAIEFLLDQGADPHIEDLAGMDACDHAKKYGLAGNYEELQDCNDPSLRKQPLTSARQKGENNAQSQPQPLGKKRNQKYAKVYQDVSQQMDQEPTDGALLGSQILKEQQEEPVRREQGFLGSTDISSGQNSVERVAQRRDTRRSPPKGNVDISMRLDEPMLKSQDPTRSLMKAQLKSLKQRAVQQSMRSGAGRRLSSREAAEKKLAEAEQALVEASAYFERDEARETANAEGVDEEAEDDRKTVEKKRQELDQKFREAEFQDGIEKKLNAHIVDNLEQSVNIKKEANLRLKQRRLQERAEREQRSLSARQSLLQSISRGDHTLESQVLALEVQPSAAKKKVNFGVDSGSSPQHKDVLARELDKALEQKEEQPLVAKLQATNDQQEQDQEYYDQLQNLELRLSGRGALRSKDILKNKLLDVVASNGNSNDMKYSSVQQNQRLSAANISPIDDLKVPKRINTLSGNQGLQGNGLRSSRSASNVTELAGQFGDLANLRKSRLLLNKHLEEKAKELKFAEKKRGNQHEDFHRAIKNTGQQLDALSRKMQSDVNRNTGRQILAAGGPYSSSLIEHELSKSKLYDVSTRHNVGAKGGQTDLMTTIEQLQRKQDQNHRNTGLRQSNSLGGLKVGGFNPNVNRQAAESIAASEQRLAGLTDQDGNGILNDRVRFPRIQQAGQQLLAQDSTREIRGPLQSYQPFQTPPIQSKYPSEYMNQLYQPPAGPSGDKAPAALPTHALLPPASHQQQFVARSPLTTGPGIVREIRLDNIVADTLNGQGKAAGALPNYKELELKRPNEAPTVIQGGLADYSKIAQMQAMMDEMARSNHLINDIGRSLHADAVNANTLQAGRYSGRLSLANRTAQSKAAPQSSKRLNAPEPGARSQYDQRQYRLGANSSKGPSVGNHGIEMADIQSKLSRLDEENSKFYDNLSKVETANPSNAVPPATRARQHRTTVNVAGRAPDRSGSNRSRASPTRSRRSLAPSERSPQRVGLNRLDLQSRQSLASKKTGKPLQR